MCMKPLNLSMTLSWAKGTDRGMEELKQVKGKAKSNGTPDQGVSLETRGVAPAISIICCEEMCGG